MVAILAEMNKFKGILAIIASAFGFAIMAACVRLCDDYGGAISSFQKSFFRNIVAFVIALVVFCGDRPRKNDGDRPRSALACPALWLRSILGSVGIFANFYALSHITIAEGQTLNKTAPFFTVIFAWLFLKERPLWSQLLAVLMAFAGVVCVSKPGFAGAAGFPLAMGLLGGMCAGAAYACVRKLAMQKVAPTFIVLFFSAFSCAASLPFMAAGFDAMTPAQVVILLGAGAGAAIGQFGVTWAYRLARPSEIAVYDYSNIFFTAALGFALFGQLPDVLALIGMAVIVAAAVFAHLMRR